MKKGYLIIAFIVLTSCNYFDVKKTSSEAILNEELKTFNWSEVDEYPTFAICEKETTKEGKKACFQNTLTQAITKNIQTDTIVVSQNLNDTLIIKFQISEKGKMSIQDFKVDSITLSEIPNIKKLVNASLDSLPQIYPAIKRGQQVKTAFTLPIVIQAN
ncbi:hypothetical protein C1T31_02965 [Hanstruepera neustonica]|uniref:TonB C-terminal domain-containing protein n=1 Tax=Hanstruepera neustonica TaxID=1445657 RepID=A0A2K1E4C0_9FLAO|nr:hypothetical protein [Hanstruepera neustonica]PNQ75113.1 hypothetical protein C1T31_02965 [Hanstruepera neustonica]